MISVPITETNTKIYLDLVELDKQFQQTQDHHQEQAIIAMANKLCENLELSIM